MRTLKLKRRETVKFSEFEDFLDKSIEKPMATIIPFSRIKESVISVFKTETDHALNILREHRYESKVFCLAESGDSTAGFEVKSNLGDWLVMPVRDNKEIPTRFLKGVHLLLKSKIQINAIAIAKPIPRESVTGVLCQEFLNTFGMLLQTFMLTLAVIFRDPEGVSPLDYNDIVDFVKDPDPVLLVCIEGKWIEIGRWE